MSCDDCAYKQEAQQEKLVPWSAVELINESHSRDKKRSWVLVIVLVLGLIISNALWLYFWNQYEYVDESDITEYHQDGRGINIIGNDNEAGQHGTEIPQNP